MVILDETGPTRNFRLPHVKVLVFHLRYTYMYLVLGCARVLVPLYSSSLLAACFSFVHAFIYMLTCKVIHLSLWIYLLIRFRSRYRYKHVRIARILHTWALFYVVAPTASFEPPHPPASQQVPRMESPSTNAPPVERKFGEDSSSAATAKVARKVGFVVCGGI